MIIPSWWRRLQLEAAVAGLALVLGAFAALHYQRLGLTLSHYDTRGHLVVARRIMDSLTPGWQQIGAVWLPLPHLLNALPVQIDAFYLTGASATAISIASFALAAGSIAWIVRAATKSSPAAVIGAGVFALNPNVLYLQSTPMTEPLLLGLTTLGVALLIAFHQGRTTVHPASVGAVLALACLTRYEAWPVTCAALAIGFLVEWRQATDFATVVRRCAAIWVWPAAAVAGFMLFSRVVVGEWFVSSGFFVPDNPVRGQPWAVSVAIWEGTYRLSSYALTVAAAMGFLALGLRSIRDRSAGPALLAISLLAAAALPWLAFLEGHPFRIRYMVPIVAAQGVGVGLAAGLLQRAHRHAWLVVATLLVFQPNPLSREAPMVLEAQWDRPNADGRRSVTERLTRDYDGATVMASMGSLGHYMQDLSAEGFELRDFVHEGNGDIWLGALEGPRPFVGWVLIEERSEGGDILARRARENPRWLEGFTRVAEGAGLALYRRDPR